MPSIVSGFYDPLTYENLMGGLVLHFENEKKKTLTNENIKKIASGPGVYALYYSGSFGPYASVAKQKGCMYVGRAIPPGSRKGGNPDVHSPALRKRLSEHIKSIIHVSNLRQTDFKFRVLLTLPIWIDMAENALNKHYKPVWNDCLDGFGNHAPGSGREKGQRSWWDTLHPGREWAENLPSTKTASEAKALVKAFLEKQATQK